MTAISGVNLEEAQAKLVRSLRREITDERVLLAMERTPRELFVPKASRHLAYEDIPLPIGEDQTISQPFIVALMTQYLELKGDEKVLEIGTGSGYQAAILAQLGRHIITVERHKNLADKARERLRNLGLVNVVVHLAGETLGWPDDAPYDAIVVTAGALDIPPVLIEQLAHKGRMVIPIGSRYEQDLKQGIKEKDKLKVASLGPCRFVPLIGEGAWVEEEISLN